MKYHGLSATRRKHLACILATGKGAITIDAAAEALTGTERRRDYSCPPSIAQGG